MRFLRRVAVACCILIIKAAHACRYGIYRLLGKQLRGLRVILVRDNHIVLVRHWYAPAVWTLPGGAITDTESDEDAATREVKEETGYVITKFDGELGTYEHMFGKHDLVRVLIASNYEGGIKVVPDFEIMQRGIFALDNLPETLSPSNRRRIEAYKSGVREEQGKW